LDCGIWRVVENKEVAVPRSWLPYESLRSSGFINAKIIGSKNVTEFLNAFYGLVPWDDWKDPAYLDKLLLSPKKKPPHLIFKNKAN
jgi:hypothetical protein